MAATTIDVRRRGRARSFVWLLTATVLAAVVVAAVAGLAVGFLERLVYSQLSRISRAVSCAKGTRLPPALPAGSPGEAG